MLENIVVFKREMAHILRLLHHCPGKEIIVECQPFEQLKHVPKSYLKKEHDPQANEEISDTPDEKERLYIDVLRTINNAVGAPVPNSPVNIILI